MKINIFNNLYRLKLTISGRYISASIQHFENGKVIRASSNEWALRKQLYSSTDYSAYTNLARVSKKISFLAKSSYLHFLFKTKLRC